MIRAASLVAATLLVGCSSAAASPVEVWTEPDTYSFVLESRCGERTLFGRFAIDVEDGEVVTVRGIDIQGRAAASALPLGEFPTLADLLALAADARATGADRVALVSDPDGGHPVSVEIDWRVDTTDDEACYTVSEYVIGE